MPQASAQLGANGFLGFGGSDEGGELSAGTPGRWMLYWWIASVLWLVIVWRAVEGY
jgi:hypothetical protein